MSDDDFADCAALIAFESVITAFIQFGIIPFDVAASYVNGTMN